MKKNIIRITCFTGFSLWCAIAHSESAVQAFETASTNEKIIICAPFLMKQGSLLELASKRAADSGDFDKSKEIGLAAFNSQYRGETLESLGYSSNKSLLKRAWALSAEKHNRDAYAKLVPACTSLYNEQWQAGKISKDVEARALDKVRSAMRESRERQSITPDCRSKVSPNVDLCATAKAYADAVAKELPVRLNQNLTMATVVAAGTRVVLTSTLGYDRKYLESMAASGSAPMQSINAAMVKSAQVGACEQPIVKSFINNGGSVQYKYRFNDGSSYMNPVVSNCK